MLLVNGIERGKKMFEGLDHEESECNNGLRRSGTAYIPFAGGPDPERIVVSMLEFKGEIYVATQKGVYILRDEKLERIKMVEKVDDNNGERHEL